MPKRGSATYYLDRVTPGGRERRQGPFGTRAGAASAAGYVLHDNNVASKREAQTFAATMIAHDTGATVEHASGYRFTITREG